jgi:small subunit ribosomal protein S11
MADEQKNPEAEKPPVEAAETNPVLDLLAPPSADAKPVVVKKRAKGAKLSSVGIAFIRASFNNTIVTLTDPRGNTVSWSSSGKCGFKGSRKSTAYAATVVAQEAARAAMANVGMRDVEVCVQGPGAGRESAIRGIQSAGLNVTAIRDITPVPHNGCRPPKARRV